MCNGSTQSGMGLTRERWCCARRWLSRLDMNTCQTSIKTSIFPCLGSPHLGYQRHETPQWLTYRTNQRGKLKQTNTALPNTYHGETTETIITSHWSAQPTNLSAFWNRIILALLPLLQYCLRLSLLLFLSFFVSLEMLLFPSIFVPLLPLSICMERTSYVFSSGWYFSTL